MRSNKCYLALLVFALLSMRTVAQQTVQFSQYVFNGLAINPAYAGYKEDWTANLSSRLQWTGISGAPQTGTLSIDGVTDPDRKNVGLGLLATFDQLGPESTTSVFANYAYRLRLDDIDTKRLSFGIAFGGVQYSLDGAKFNATDAGDAGIPTGTVSKLTPDFRFGMYYYTPNFYAGVSVFNLLAQSILNATDNTALIKQQRTYYLTAGTLVPLSEDIDLKPSFMIKEDFAGPTNLDITSYIVFKRQVWIGASCRTGISIFNKNNLQTGLDASDAIAAIAQFYVNENFRIGYSFDFTTSKLANYQSGSHELSITITFPGKNTRVLSPRYF